MAAAPGNLLALPQARLAPFWANYAPRASWLYTHTRCDSGGERFLLSFRGPSKPATSVADLGGGVYGFAYASAVSGPYVMSLTLHGVHLPGSPFTVTLGEHAT